MRLLACIDCGRHVEVEGAVDRVWCVDCVLGGNGTQTVQRSPRTERFQKRLI